MRPGPATARVVQHALARPPTLGAARLICIDGPSGSGKTTLAAEVARRTGAQLLEVDEMFPGWDGFAEIPSLVARVLTPLASGRDGHWQRYDWASGRYAEWHRVRPGGTLVLDGVGAGHRRWSRVTTTLVWVEAPRAERLRRGRVRNDQMIDQWRRWQVQEDAMFARERTRARSDLQVLTGDP